MAILQPKIGSALLEKSRSFHQHPLRFVKLKRREASSSEAPLAKFLFTIAGPVAERAPAPSYRQTTSAAIGSSLMPSQ